MILKILINMKMKFILVPVLLALTFGAAAQPQVKVKSDTTETVTYDGNKFRVQTAPARANWFIGLQGGGQLIFGDHDKQCKLGDRIAPALDIYFGKWFTPVVGGRVRYSGLSFKGATQTDVHSTGKDVPGKGGHGYWLTKQKFSYVEFAGDVMCNLSNAFGGYRPDRFYSAIPYVGLGVGRVTQNPKTTELMGHIGYLSAFRVCDAVDINLDLRTGYVNDRFDGEEGGRYGEGILAATIGVTYKFKPRGFGRTKTVTRVISSEYDVSDYQRVIDETKAENERLMKEVEELRNLPRWEEGKTKTLAYPYYIVFELGKSELLKASRVNLGMLAEIIKANNVVYVITGYADQGTGSKRLNEKLSQDRAKAVYDCLVNEYGVPASLLKTAAKGGVGNMFYDDPALSRAAIALYEGDKE